MVKKTIKVRGEHGEFATSESSETRRAKAKAPKKKKTKYSNYYITINSNLDTSKINKEAFKRRTQRVFDRIADFIKIKNKGDDEDDIDDVSYKTRPEVGPDRKLVHMHALVRIKHRTKVKLDYKAIRKALVKEGAVRKGKGFHFYAKLFRDNRITLLDYINKTRERASDRELASRS